MKPETQAIHTGHQIDPATGAVITPIYLSTTFERGIDGEYPHGFVYSRSENPNRDALEARLCALEGGAAAAMFASGSVATMSLLQALAAGDHVLAPDNIYFGVRLIMTGIMGRWGLETSFVDMTDLAAVKQAVQPNTKLVIIETPSNPQIKVTDISGVAGIAHEAGALLACDNTIPTPVFQRPFDRGADIVIHATTKYIGGHSDVMGGALIFREVGELFERVRQIQTVGGAVPSPFECWLTLRGMETLPYRMQAHAHNATQVAQFLNDHPAVERVLYPGLPDDPGHEVAQQQMSGYGGLMSFLIRGGQAEAMAVTNKLKLITRATSFGGTHSLIEHRASIEEGTTTPENLLRLSVGLENADDLIADLAQALV